MTQSPNGLVDIRPGQKHESRIGTQKHESILDPNYKKYSNGWYKIHKDICVMVISIL